MRKRTTRDVGSPELEDSAGRRLYWWHMPVRPERNVEAGEKMLASVAIWLVSLVGLMIALALVFG